MIKACLNGDRRPGSHPRLPVTPAQCAAAAAAAVRAGAGMVHVHPRGPAGAESLTADDVVACVDAVTHAVSTRVSVSTRDGIVASVEDKLAAVRSWPGVAGGGPHCASVNWHEPGAVGVANLLHSKGIGVEAGIWSARAAALFMRSDWPNRVERVLVEVIPGQASAPSGVLAAERVLSALGRQTRPVLVHGEGHLAWEVLRWAQASGYDTRIGLEDTLVFEDGTEARDNADLVAAALRASGVSSWWPAPDADPLLLDE